MFNVNRKNQLGFFKDELCGNTLKEFVGIRSKTYAMNIEKKGGQTEIKRRTKGVVKGYREMISFEDFLKCVQKIDEQNITQFHIRSHVHTITTNKITKLCFSSFDDKRYLFSCGIHSVPYNSILIETSSSCPFCK